MPPVVTVVGDATVTVTVNDSFSLQVTLSQYNLQPVTVEWERNGVSLSSGEKYQLSSNTSQLGDGSAELIVRFTESLVDNGTYTVTANNAAGIGSVDFEVFIMSECECVKWFLYAQVIWSSACLSFSILYHFVSLAPSLPVAPEAAILDSQKPTVTTSEGAPDALMCTATGVPAPTFSWFRNGVLLSDDSVTLVITSSTDDTMSLLSVTSTLNVTSVMRESAFATITCTASNGVGANSSDSTQLIVLCKLFMLLVMGNSSRWRLMCRWRLSSAVAIIHFLSSLCPISSSSPHSDCHLSQPDSDLPSLCLLQLHCGQLPSLHHHLAPQWG